MRKVIIIFAVLLTACGNKQVETMLNTAENVIDNRPDSAMTILEEMDRAGSKLGKKQRMRYLLLRTIAMDKLDIKLDTIDYMDEVTEYYNDDEDCNLRTKAYYMAGGVYRDRGNSPKALEYYRKAITAADTTQADCDFKTLSRIYGQIATLFHLQASPDLELEAGRQAVKYAEMAGDTIGAIIFYENLENAYYLKKDYDAMIRIFNNAYKRYIAAGETELAAGSLPAIIEIYIKKDMYNEAKAAMNEFEQKSGLFDEKGEIEQGKEMYYECKGLYYENIGQNDSALFYYRKLLRFKDCLTFAEAGYRGLMNTYYKMGVTDSIVKYSRLFALANDSTTVLASSENIVKTKTLYDYTESLQIAKDKTEEAQKIRYASLLMVVVTVITSYYIYKYIRNQSRKSKKHVAKANSKYYEMLYKYNESVKEMTMLKAGFDNYKDNKEREADKLRQEINILRNNYDLPEICDIEQTLLECAILKRLHENAAKIKKTASSEWEELHRVTSEHLPEFYNKITDSKIKLTQKEINVCILTKLQFLPNEIVLITDMSKQGISNIRSRINKKLFEEEGTKNLDKNLLKL